jgi:FHA domain/Bacterial regulatory protein, Fis family
MNSVVLSDTPTRETFRRLSPMMSAEQPRILLILTMGDGSPRLLEFGARNYLTVGRAEPSEVCINDSGISRMHARFTREGAGVRVIDLGSRNGTWLRGARITDALLNPGECVVLGETTVLIQTTLSPAAAADASGSFKATERSGANGVSEIVPEDGLNLRASLQEHEAKLIRDALRVTSGNQRRAAALLKLPLRTFERKLRNITLRAQRAAERPQ